MISVESCTVQVFKSFCDFQTFPLILQGAAERRWSARSRRDEPEREDSAATAEQLAQLVALLPWAARADASAALQRAGGDLNQARISARRPGVFFFGCIDGELPFSRI